jgi:hypothetical protein
MQKRNHTKFLRGGCLKTNELLFLGLVFYCFTIYISNLYKNFNTCIFLCFQRVTLSVNKKSRLSLRWTFVACLILGVNKKIEKLIKSRKPEKNNWKNRTVKKNRPVQFGFISLKLKKQNRTQTGKNQAKPEKNSKNRAKPSKTSLNRFLS